MTDNLRGILAVLLASTAFVLNDAIIKHVSAELPSGEIIVVRGVISTAMLFVCCALLGLMRPLAILMTRPMLVRIAAAAGATMFIVLALRYLPLATVATVVQVTPLAVTAGAAIVYGERVGWRRWLAALTGFLGVVLIVRPGGAIFGGAAYLAIAALLFTTTRDLTTRGLDRAIPSMFVAAASSAAITLTGFLVMPFEGPWLMPPWSALGPLIISGACLLVANTFMIAAMRTGEIAVVAPFRYAPVPLAVWLGYLWWGDMPDAVAFLGIALVIGAGLYTLHCERATLRRPALPPAAERSPVP